MGQSKLAKLVPEFWFIPRHPLPCGSSTCCSARLLFGQRSRDDPPRERLGRHLCDAQLVPSTRRVVQRAEYPICSLGRRDIRRRHRQRRSSWIAQSNRRRELIARPHSASTGRHRIRRPLRIRKARERSAQLRMSSMMPNALTTTLTSCAARCDIASLAPSPFLLRRRSQRAETRATASACPCLQGPQPMQRQSALSSPSSQVA
jgi:hypothetical protein